MSKFEEMLKQPLPSKAAEIVATEGEECADTVAPVDDDLELPDNDVSLAASDDDEDEEMSDEELAELENELAKEMIGEDLPEEELSPEEEVEADDFMAVAATTSLINQEMNSTEKTQFAESATDIRAAINEGFLTESDVKSLAASGEVFTEGKTYNKPMIIRLDKQAKLKQLFSIAVNASASAHKDPDYNRYKKIMKAKKALKLKLTKKYKSEATKRMKIYFKRLTSSKSPALASLGKSIVK